MVLEKNLSFIKTYKEDWNSVMFEISKNNVSYQGKKHLKSLQVSHHQNTLSFKKM